MAKAFVLIADITGSTKLYEQLSDRDALTQISIILARMRTIIEEAQGHCVKSQGDDTLSFFGQADQAFGAARAMVESDWSYGLSVHAGVYFGDIVGQENDIYGNTVNTAARLAALAKPGEVLLGGTVFDALSEPNRLACVPMGELTLKGKKAGTRTYSFSVSELTTQTVVFQAKTAPVERSRTTVELSCEGRSWTLSDGQSLMVGRSPDCTINLQHPWVSRKHGTFELRAAQLEYTDHSSSGSVVVTSDNMQFEVQRRATLLTGQGCVLVGTSSETQTDSRIEYSTIGLSG